MPSYVRHPGLAFAACAAFLSCDGGPTEDEPRIATSFAIFSGDDQRATVGTRLRDPIVVRATDAEGRVVPGAIVNFVVATGGGSVFAPTVMTNAEGLASNRWTLGPAAGTQTVEVRAIDEHQEPVTYAVVAATALPDVPATISRVSPDGLSGVVGAAAPESLAVRVTDRYDNAVPEVTVTWTAAGGGSVDPASSVTNREGIAKTQLTLPPTAGPGEVTASVTGLVSYSMPTVARVGDAAALEAVSGNGQRAGILATLDAPLVAKVADAHGNAVEGATVTWTTTSGSIAPGTTMSNDDGVVSASWTFGTVAGVMTATAILEGIDTITFSATATPGRPNSVVLMGGDDQTAETGEVLPEPLEVEVRDFYGNRVPEATVHWTVAEGGGSVSPAMSVSNAFGVGTTSWTLGAPGPNRVVATVGGAGSVEFTATALAPTGLVLTAGDGNGRSVVAGGSLILTARLTNANGAGVESATVSWRVVEQPDATRPTAQVSPVTSVTDANGYARTTLTAGTVTGSVAVEASVPNVVPAMFRATVTAGPIAHFRTGADFPASGLAGSTITFDLEYIDQYGNAAPSPARSWTSLPGANGAWSPSSCGVLSTTETDETNVARATWKLCTIPGASSAYFIALHGHKATIDLVTLGQPTTLARVHTQSDLGETIHWVQITDAEGKPGGPPITVTVTSGSGTVSQSTAPYALYRLAGRRTDPSQSFTVTVSAPGYASLQLTF